MYTNSLKQLPLMQGYLLKDATFTTKDINKTSHDVICAHIIDLWRPGHIFLQG